MSTSEENVALERLTTAIPPALEQFLNTAREKVLGLAAVEGYAPEEADWIEQRMRLPLLQQIADGQAAEDALSETYRAARRALLVEIFERNLGADADRTAAFRRLIDLEYVMAMRLGQPTPSYSEALVTAGCEAAAAAAAEGASSAEQIDSGFAIMRQLAPFDPTRGTAQASSEISGMPRFL